MNIAASVDRDDLNLFTIASLSQRKAARFRHPSNCACCEAAKLRPHEAEQSWGHTQNPGAASASCLRTCRGGWAFIDAMETLFCFCD
jgi:hypothetical protein